MYIDISSNCKEVLSRSSRRFTASIILGDNTISNIKAYVLTKPSSADKTPLIGSSASNSLEMIIQTDRSLDKKDVELIQSVLLDSGEYEDIPMGHYTVTSAVEKNGLVTIKAAGYLKSKAEKAYFSNLEYPTTTLEVLNEISTQIGVAISVDGLIALAIEEKLEGYTCREMIGYIACMYGMFATELRDGSIGFKWYEYCEDDVLTDKISEPELEQSINEISTLKVTTADNEQKVRGSGLNGINISNPFMTDAAMDIAWERIEGFTYRPGNIHILSATPCMDVWDIYSYSEDNIICCDMVLTYDGGLQCEISSGAIVETDDTSSKGPVTKQLERYYAELVLINQAMINKLTVEEADIRYLRVDKLEAITLEVEEAVIENLSTDFADIHLSNIDVADIGEFYAKSGILGEVVIKEGSVTGVLNGVKINGDLIIANTLKVKDLLLEGDDGLIYQINALASGLTSEQLSDEQYTSKLSGSDLLANSVTADKINVNDLTAFDADIAGFKITRNSDLDLNNAVVDSGTFAENGNGSWNLNGEISFNNIEYFGYPLVFKYGYLTNAITEKYGEITFSGTYRGEVLRSLSVGFTLPPKTGNVEYMKVSKPYGVVKLLNSSGEAVVPDNISISISINGADIYEFNVEGLRYGSIAYGTDSFMGNDKSIYLSPAGISLGQNFAVTPEGFVTAKAGTVGCLSIKDDGKLINSITGDPALDDDYIQIVYEAHNIPITASITAMVNGTTGLTARGLHTYRQYSYSDVAGTYNTNPYDRSSIETILTSDGFRVAQNYYDGSDLIGTLDSAINFTTTTEMNTMYSLCELKFDMVTTLWLIGTKVQTSAGADLDTINNNLGTVVGANSNYFKIGNYVVQWGTTVLNRYSNTLVYGTATFPVTFIDTNYIALVNPTFSIAAPSAYGASVATAASLNKANFTPRVFNGSSAFTTTNIESYSVNAIWLAIGRWK